MDETTGQPVCCRPEAYELLARQVEHLEATEALLRGAIAISLHELPRTDPDHVTRRIDSLIEAIQRRVHSDRRDALLAHAHQVLFEELGLAGNRSDYYHPHNSYVERVLQTKRGLPITLSLIYTCVLRGLGVPAEGINAPLHFMVAVEAEAGRLIVDPFMGGDAMHEDEAVERIARAAGSVVPRSRDILPVASHRQWLTRMLGNLIRAFRAADRRSDATAMAELQSLLNG